MLLPGCDVEPMLTNDAGGVYRADNHAWLFAYKSNSIFQAGPSRKMNGYNVNGVSGSWTAAGMRASDPDSMCGDLTPLSTANAHLIELGAVGDAPAVA
ncbi:hypothetical protein F5X96DRAFT_693030 [Biscogniauxia mediterranea]|nr:hypothetical protein F5X96DRAFT_693030 [Biscogniauxia mediterranea]